MNIQLHASRPRVIAASLSPGEGAGVRAGLFSDVSRSGRFAARTPRSKTAFTLIELLVVMGIVAILSALILATAGYAMSRARRARVETERETLVAAIQSYKADKGFYPQDNTLNPALPPLFYELTGTAITLNNGQPASYYSSTSGDTLNTPADFNNVFGNTPKSVTGFINASTDPTQVKNYFGAASKSARTGRVLINNGLPVIIQPATPFTVFGVTVSGPIQYQVPGGVPISPWSYVSTSPTNNSGSYDLWMDVYYSGKTNRISNWSRDPEIVP